MKHSNGTRVITILLRTRIDGKGRTISKILFVTKEPQCRRYYSFFFSVKQQNANENNVSRYSILFGPYFQFVSLIDAFLTISLYDKFPLGVVRRVRKLVRRRASMENALQFATREKWHRSSLYFVIIVLPFMRAVCPKIVQCVLSQFRRNGRLSRIFNSSY